MIMRKQLHQRLRAEAGVVYAAKSSQTKGLLLHAYKQIFSPSSFPF